MAEPNLRHSAMRQSGTLYWLLADHLGSTAVVANASGTKVGEVRYRAWGCIGEAALRPALGRFVQPDTVVPEPGNPQGLNRFAYVRNNPLRYTDPTGHYAFEEKPDDDYFDSPTEGNPAVHSSKPSFMCHFPVQAPWHPGDLPYGAKYDYPERLRGKPHPGEDIFPNNSGDLIPVVAMMNGTVLINKEIGGYGNCLVLEHVIPNGEIVYSLYAHLAEKPALEVGSMVKGGEQIGNMGNTGTCPDGKHLHFEIRKASGVVKPAPGEPYLVPWKEFSSENLNHYFYSPFRFLEAHGVQF